MRKIANRLGGYTTVAGAFAMAFFIAVVPVRQAFASTIAQQPDYSSYTEITGASPVETLTASQTGTVTSVSVGVLTSDISSMTNSSIDISLHDTTHSAYNDAYVLGVGGYACSSFTTSGAYTFYNCPFETGSFAVTSGDTITATWQDGGDLYPAGVTVAAAAGATYQGAGYNYSSSADHDSPFIILSSSPLSSLGGGGGGGFTMSATTTAIFTALGIPWGSIYGSITGAVAQSGYVLLDIFLALWPLWLGIGVLLFVIGIPWYIYHRARQGR